MLSTWKTAVRTGLAGPADLSPDGLMTLLAPTTLVLVFVVAFDRATTVHSFDCSDEGTD